MVNCYFQSSPTALASTSKDWREWLPSLFGVELWYVSKCLCYDWNIVAQNWCIVTLGKTLLYGYLEVMQAFAYSARANQPIPSFFVGTLQPYLERMSVHVGSPSSCLFPPTSWFHTQFKFFLIEFCNRLRNVFVSNSCALIIMSRIHNTAVSGWSFFGEGCFKRWVASW